MAASRPAFPSEPNLRRLGVGGGGGGGDRVLRAQIVIAVVMSFTILAVLLYLLRRPSGTENAPRDAGADASGPAADAGGIIRTKIAPPASAKMAEPDVMLGAAERVKCSSSAKVHGNEGSLCDRLPIFEEALEKAIKASHDCAPKPGKAGTLNYVLTVDFTRKTLQVFPGASGEWRGPQARRATRCVQNAMAAPQWDAIPHQYRYYMIAILAKYPAPAPLDSPAFE